MAEPTSNSDRRPTRSVGVFASREREFGELRAPRRHTAKGNGRMVMWVGEPGGSVYIQGTVLDDPRLSPLATVLSSLNFLNIHDGGQSYTEGEYSGWLTQVGFQVIERAVVSDGSSIMAAKKPGLAVA